MKNAFGISLLLWLGRCTDVSSLLVPRQGFGNNHCNNYNRCGSLLLSRQHADGDGDKKLKSLSRKSRPLESRKSPSSRPYQAKSYKYGKYAGSKRQRPQRQISSGVEKFVRNFANGEEINTWMEEKTNQQKAGALEGPPLFPSTWSSRDETDFIRALRDVGAYQALELFVNHFARKNVFVFTAAISALANSRDSKTRARALILLDKMDETEVLPSSFTFAALFQSIDGPEAAKQLMLRLQAYKGRASFSVESFNQAIMACSRRIPGRHPTNKSWQVALDFAHNLRREGLRPDLRTYTSLLNVCAQTGQVRIAMSLFREIEGNPELSPNARVFGSLLNVCAQAGDYKLANDVLKTMKESGNHINLFHCSAFLKALSRNGKVDMCLQVLDMMTGSATSSEGTVKAGPFQMTEFPKIAPDLVALNTILKSCAQAGHFHAARKLVDRMKNGEFSTASISEAIFPDEISYSLLLSSCSDPLAARSILKEMQLSRRYRVGVVRPSSITYARAIAVCRRAEAPDVESARFFLASARKDPSIEPTVFMFSAAIWTAERSGNYSMAKQFLDEMKAEGIAANSISYTGVISAAAKNGQVDKAIALWEEMKSRGCVPTTATYNALALSVRNSLLPNKKEKLEYIFDKLDVADRHADVGGSVIEALTNEYGRKGSYDSARRVFDMIEGPCNGHCLRAMLLACATASPGPRWEEAISILHCSDITSSATGPGEMDQGALGNAMIACAKADRWEEGLNLLQLYGVRTPRRSRSISVVALNAVMASCGRKGRPDMAFSILNDMERYGVKPDERSYRSVIVACNQAEHQKRREQRASSNYNSIPDNKNEHSFQWWEACITLLRRMREDGLQPDIQTFSSCISACEAAGQWQRALAILQSMIDTSSEGEETEFLNLFCFNAAISSCEKGGAWVEALEIYERMISYGGLLKPNFVTLSSIVLALANAGQKELAESKYTEGVKMKIVNPWRTTKSSSGRSIKAMDLHMFNSAMASSAVRSFLDSLLKRGKELTIEDDFVIIVGKGLRSAEDPILLPTLQELLKLEYGVTAEVEPENKGRLIIKAEALRALIAGRRW